MAALVAHWILAILCVVGVAGNLRVIRHPPVTLPAIHLGRQVVQMPTIRATGYYGMSRATHSIPGFASVSWQPRHLQGYSVGTSSYGIHRGGGLLGLISQSEINDFPASNAPSPHEPFMATGNSPASGSNPLLFPATGVSPGNAPALGSTPSLFPTTGVSPGNAPALGSTPSLFPATGVSPGNAPALGSTPSLFPTIGLSPGNAPASGSTQPLSPGSGLSQFNGGPLSSSAVVGGVAAQFPAAGDINVPFSAGSTPLQFQAGDMTAMESSGTGFPSFTQTSFQTGGISPGTSGSIPFSFQPSNTLLQFPTSGTPSFSGIPTSFQSGLQTSNILQEGASHIPMSLQFGNSPPQFHAFPSAPNTISAGSSPMFLQSPTSTSASLGSSPMSFPTSAILGLNSGVNLPM